MSYTTGLDAVKANLDAMSSQINGQWLNELYWDGKKTSAENKRFLRPLTDDVISIAVHEYVPTLNGKKYDFICAKAMANPRDCIICDTFQVTNDDGQSVPAKPRVLTYGLVVLRDEITSVVDGRRVSQFIDVEVEIDVNGTKKKGRDYRIVKQSQKTFWANFHGYFARYGTIIDRDYEVSRTGNTGSNTVYTILPCDPIDGLRTKEEVEARYSDCPESIIDYIERMGSVARYDKFLIKGPQTSTQGNGGNGGGGQTSQSATQSTPAAPATNDTSFGSLRDKLMTYSSNKSS